MRQKVDIVGPHSSHGEDIKQEAGCVGLLWSQSRWWWWAVWAIRKKSLGFFSYDNGTRRWAERQYCSEKAGVLLESWSVSYLDLETWPNSSCHLVPVPVISLGSQHRCNYRYPHPSGVFLILGIYVVLFLVIYKNQGNCAKAQVLSFNEAGGWGTAVNTEK